MRPFVMRTKKKALFFFRDRHNALQNAPVRQLATAFRAPIMQPNKTEPTLMPLVGCWVLYCPQLKSYSLSQSRSLRSARLNYGRGTIGAIDASRRDPRSGRTGSSLQPPPVDRLAERNPIILMTSVFRCVCPYWSPIGSSKPDGVQYYVKVKVPSRPVA